jgi:hypothetical protein
MKHAFAALLMVVVAARSFAATVERRDRTTVDGALSFQADTVAITDAAGKATAVLLKDVARIAFHTAPRTTTLSNASWNSKDIGEVFAPGATSFSNSVLTLKASGWGLWRDADGLRFASVPLPEDGEIVARVHDYDTSHGTMLAGISIREGLGPRARHVSLVQSSKGTLTFRSRGDEGFLRRTMPIEQTNAWLRLARSGTRLTAYISSDGKEWMPVEGATLHATNALHVGVFASTELNGTPGSATFRDVTIHEGTVAKRMSDLPAPAVVLRDGTILAGQILATNEAVLLVRGGRTNEFSMGSLAALLFRPVAADVVLQPPVSARTGVVMNDRDWLEGEVREVSGRGVTVATVLFGSKVVRWSDQPAAVVLGGRTDAAEWELIFKDGSQVRARSFSVERESGTARTIAMGSLPFEISDLLEIRASADR